MGVDWTVNPEMLLLRLNLILRHSMMIGPAMQCPELEIY